MIEVNEYFFKQLVMIDDNEIDIMIATKILQLGLMAENITTFNSCQEALDYLSSLPLSGHPDVILLDLNMPDMNGKGFLSYIDDNPGTLSDDCKIYVVSSSISAKELKDIIGNPRIKNYLSKPLNAAKLKTILEL